MIIMFLGATSWSGDNVDATLIGWATRTQQTGVSLTIATCRTDTVASNAAIANLRATPWTITFPGSCAAGTN
jgi:hypothetical protein